MSGIWWGRGNSLGPMSSIQGKGRWLFQCLVSGGGEDHVPMDHG